MRLLPIALLIALVAVFGEPASTSLAGPTTFDVNSETDAPDDDLNDGVCETAAAVCTVRAGVMQANASGGPAVINVPEGTYTLTIPHDAGGNQAATGDLFIDTELTIEGAGESLTIVDGNGGSRIFDIAGGSVVTIANMLIQNGDAGGAGSHGGAIRSGTDSAARLTLRDVRVTESSADIGGGISANGFLRLTRTTVNFNDALSEAGGIYYDGTGDGNTLSSQFLFAVGNISGGSSGGMAIYGTAVLNSSTVSSNEARDAGGGIGAYGNVTLEYSGLEGNTVTTLSDTGGSGGGIYAEDATLRLFLAGANTNTAPGRGGGMMIVETTDGSSNVTIEQSSFNANVAGQGGGGIRMGAGDEGGGGHVTITRSAFTRNSASAGGGIYNFGNGQDSVLDMVNVTISENSSTGDGAGVRSLGPDAETRISYSTIADNDADADGDSDGAAGGISQGDGPEVEIHNTILAYNTAFVDPDCAGDIRLDDGNIVSQTSVGCNLSAVTPDDLLDVDPMIGPLADNGLGQETHALSPDSPALDVGSDCPPPDTDQRGVNRPQGDDCDIGAHEAVGAVIWGDYDCSGVINPADTLPQLFHLSGVPATSGDCPEVGSGLGGQLTWGNTDCFNPGVVLTLDIVLLLELFAGLRDDYPKATGCPSIGDPVEGS